MWEVKIKDCSEGLGNLGELTYLVEAPNEIDAYADAIKRLPRGKRW